MPLTTDFNVPPYFDDYDPANNYYRILFRPSVAVQARELTQTQTIIQSQIERFGDHVFKDGAVVSGCDHPVPIPNFDYVRVADSFTANANAIISTITSDYLLVGATSNVRAIAVITKAGSLINYPDTNRFYLKYLQNGSNNQYVFASGETIQIYKNTNKTGNAALDANNLVNTISVLTTNSTVNATGKGYGLSLDSGVVYQKGFMQDTAPQTIVIRDYDQNVADYVVGFQTLEEIVTENTDSSLLDNALGYSNENAPGAHRLKLTPTLVAKSRSEIANNDTFFSVFEFSNVTNELAINRQKTPYDILADIMYQRTYDESGNYVVKPFLTETIPGPNTASFSYQVSSGKGFVLGSEIEYLAARKVDADKATTTQTANQQIITANYGNFVYVKEYSGALDFANFVTVDLYDTAFQAITNKYTPSLIGKTKIGSAKVKSVLHDSGDAGLSATTYRVYLTDIVMNSGKSFSNDVKSIYLASGTFGAFYADMVLDTNSRVTLQQSGKSSLVFPFGKKALKTLRSANGTYNGNEFYFRVSETGTVLTNGLINISNGSSYTGGVDTIGYSTGILGDTLEKDFIVVFTANASTINVASNTVSITSGCNQVTGVNLNTYFAPGEFIRITENSTNNYYQVTSANTTRLVLATSPSTTNATCVFGKHFPAGYAVPLVNGSYPGTRTINITSNTGGVSFTVNTGLSVVANLTSNASCVVQYRKLRTTATQAKKDVSENRFIKLYANAASNNAWNLGLPDVYNIKHVYANTTAFSNNDSDEITSYFILDNGQRDDYYDHARLVLKPQYAGSLTNQYLTVVVDHFTANLNSGIGFFSVDSYPVDDANTANTNAITTAQIPVYYTGNTVVDLRDSVDFRGYKANTAVSATTLADATLNPATTNNFVTTTAYLVEPDTNFQADIEYYLGRIDLVTMNKTGGLSVIQGVASESPKTPVADVDVMVISTAAVPPYPSLSVREAATYGRLDYAVRTKISTNRGYTMRDIGLFDERIKRLEYYTTLNMLEQKAQNVQVPDANGLNRFKNGIFADPMNSHALANASDIEYRYSIDTKGGYGRPLFSSENIDLMFSNSLSTGVQVTGKSVTRPYTHELYIYQPFATKVRNNSEDAWSWKGSMNLYPSYDMNRDETLLPNIDASIDITQPFLQFANIVSQATGATIFGTRYGDWRTISSTTTSPSRFWYTTTTTQEQTNVNTFIVPITNSVDLGKYVTDVSVQPYMKSRVVSFVARNLKPNAKVYAFFDDTPVSKYCAPANYTLPTGTTWESWVSLVSVSGHLEDVTTRSAPWGTQLVTDSNGTIYGQFQIPAGTFRTGDRQFQLVDVNSLVTGSDAYMTRAAATFTASNISVTTRNATISSVQPDIQQSSFTDTRTTINSWYREPIAQSLTINAPEQQSGVFVTKVDLFFKQKDPNLGIAVNFVGMNSGVPDTSSVLGTARLESSQVNVSDDASVASTFVFENPIFVNDKTEYAFYILADGNSPEYQMWMSEVGYTDVTTGAQVYKNPYAGDAFRSSNSKTWTALPKEDIKFNLYVANFQTGSGTAYFNNEDDDYISYSTLALANSQTTVAVGDEVYLINSASNVALSNTSVTGRVQFIDTTNAKMVLDSSTGGFAANATIGIFRTSQFGNTSQANASSIIATAKITTVNNPVLNAIVPRFATMQPLGTTIGTSFSGTSNAGVYDSSYYDLSMEEEREMIDYERRVYSKSNEGVNKSLTIKNVLSASNKYLSPVIDLSRKSALIIDNIINNDNTNEHTRYGNALAKYISQPIVLADGQEAEDLKVYISGYRPINTDIEVYVKFLNNEDSATLNDKVWTKLNNDNAGVYCSPIDPVDFKEYSYSMPTSAPVTYAAYANPSNYGILRYADSNGSVYNSYKTFMIKIVLLSTNGTYVPKVDDLRGIALQV
jgi:hypothetical protein